MSATGFGTGGNIEIEVKRPVEVKPVSGWNPDDSPMAVRTPHGFIWYADGSEVALLEYQRRDRHRARKNAANGYTRVLLITTPRHGLRVEITPTGRLEVELDGYALHEAYEHHGTGGPLYPGYRRRSPEEEADRLLEGYAEEHFSRAHDDRF